MVIFFFLKVIIHILTALRRGPAACEIGLCFFFFFLPFQATESFTPVEHSTPTLLIDRFGMVRLKTRSFTNFVPTNQIKLTLLGA